MEMDGYKKRFDWASLILGIVLVVLGCVSIMHPDKSLHLLCILVGVGLLLLGSMSFGPAARCRNGSAIVPAGCSVPVF